MSSVIQRSLSGGELDPALWARSDTSKYMTGLRTLRNANIRRNGGALGRPGSALVQPVKNSSNKGRLIPFIYNQQTAYMMEFGDKYIRFYVDGQPFRASGATPYGSGSSYPYGSLVTSGGVIYFCCANQGGSSSAVTFELNPALYGTTYTGITGHAPVTYPGYWYPLTANIYEVPTPWAYADLPLLRFDQTANDMVITHPSYAPMRLTRIPGATAALDQFVLFLIQTGSYMQVATNVHNNQSDSNSFGVGGSGVVTYGIQAVSASSDEYALIGSEALTFGLTTTKTVSTTSAPVELLWNSVPGAISYNIYARNVNGVYGFLGSCPAAAGGSQVYFDYGGTPDFSNPWVLDVGQIFSLTNSGAQPTACAFYQQRLMLANTNNNPTKTWGSQTGLFDNFNISVPTLDTDSLSFKMTGRQDVVEHLLFLGVLIVFTYGTINSIQGDASGAISPSAINPHRESVHGASSLRPLVCGEFALYNQAQGSIVRDLGFNFQVDGYRGDDLTVFATHLFDNYTIVDWDYQSVPNSIVWAVRSDGALLSMTYVREQQILAWSHHDTAAGFYENVACIPEGNQVSVYVITNRTINGSTTRFVERFFNQQFTDIRNYIGMDCATTIDGRNTSSDTVTLTGGTNWNETELLTLTLSANHSYIFTTANATNQDMVFLYDSSGNLYRFKITVYSSATVVQGFLDRSLAASLQGTGTASWSIARSQIIFLNALEGQRVSVFADGNVVGSPNNPAYPVYTVTGGVINLDKPYAVINIGLPFITDIETLDIDTPGPLENLGGKMKLVGEVTISMVNSRSVFVGGANPDTDPTNLTLSPVYRLTEQKLRQNENYDSPMALQTGKITQNIQGDWDQNGHVFIRNVDPTPFLVAAISPDGLYPMRGA